MKTFVICVEVFLARMVDVSIGSVRTILLVKGKNFISTILAFIEILIWFLVAKQTLTSNETNIAIILCYAAGYAIGTYVGGLINKYFVKGELSVFVITKINRKKILDNLKNSGYGVSIISIEDNKTVLLIVLKKKHLNKFKKAIHKMDSDAFIIINESSQVENGYIA